jgi:FlaA1/EpsC-like NDP-sugar epimerase
MARTLIRLSGFVPDREIQIEFIGLRPGGKLVEELVGRNETVEPSQVHQILRVRSASVPHPNWLTEQVSTLERLAAQGDAKAAVAQLAVVVPNFRPAERNV